VAKGYHQLDSAMPQIDAAEHNLGGVAHQASRPIALLAGMSSNWNDAKYVAIPPTSMIVSASADANLSALEQDGFGLMKQPWPPLKGGQHLVLSKT
jgi:hypothetical protein